jgi:hypothetical protein
MQGMQILVTSGPRRQKMIGILDYERIVRAGDELHENLVALQGAPASCVHDFCGPRMR